MLDIYLFGQLRVLADGAPLKFGAPPKTLPLWAYLLLHPKPIARDTLAALLWPDESEAGARANLRRHLYHLQRTLPPAPTERPWLLTVGEMIGWNQDADYRLDVAEFERLLAAPETAAQGVELYSGDLLQNAYDDLLIFERERLRERYLAALYGLLTGARQERAPAPAMTYAGRILAADPLREDALRQLLAVRYESGDRAGALREYERFARLLQEELGADPMPETAAIYDAIRRNGRLPASVHDVGPAPAAEGRARTRAAALPFVGREREMELLRKRWRGAVGGAGGLLLIGGEAGIGKSRLVAELALQADLEGTRVLSGGGSFAETQPYEALAQALGAALPLVAALNIQPVWLSALLPLLPGLRDRRPDLSPLPALAPAQDRARLHEALFRCLAALTGPRPVLLILEDLHWAGAALIEFLQFLAHRLSDQRLLLLVTYREEEISREHPLRTLRRQVTQDTGAYIGLQRLSLPAVAQLVERLDPTGDGAGLAQRLHSESEGNPLFVGELLRDWLEGDRGAKEGSDAGKLPSRVQEVIGERVGRLSAQAQAVAEVAAVAGTAFNVEVLRDAGGWNETQVLDAIGELLDRQLAHEAGTRDDYDYAFAHHLIQETIYGGMRTQARVRRHRRVGQVLEELYPDRRDDLAARLALHFDRGEDAPRAVPYYLRAAEIALRVYADVEALAHLSRGLDLAAGPDQGELLLLREQIYFRQGDRPAQLADLLRLEEIAAASGDAARVNEGLRRRIHYHRALGERDKEGVAIDLLLSRVVGAGDARWRARAVQLAAEHQLLLNQYAAATELGQQALELTTELTDREGQVSALAILAEAATHAGKLRESWGLIEQALGLAETLGVAPLLITTLGTASTAAMVQQDYKLGVEVSRRLLEVSQAIGDRDSEALAHARLATHQMRMYQIVDARRHFAEAAALYGATGNKRGHAVVLVNAGSFNTRMGQVEEAIRAFEQAERIFGELGDVRGQAIAAGNYGYNAYHRGDLVTARQATQRALDMTREIDNPGLEANLLSNMGVIDREEDYFASAIERQESGLAIRRSLGQVADLWGDLSDLAITYLRAGMLDKARVLADELLVMIEGEEGAEALDHPQYRLWQVACVLRAGGEPERAADLLRRAYAFYLERTAIIADAAAQSTYAGSFLNRDVTAAYERGEWPSWASSR